MCVLSVALGTGAATPSIGLAEVASYGTIIERETVRPEFQVTPLGCIGDMRPALARVALRNPLPFDVVRVSGAYYSVDLTFDAPVAYLWTQTHNSCDLAFTLYGEALVGPRVYEASWACYVESQLDCEFGTFVSGCPTVDRFAPLGPTVLQHVCHRP
jgi:hypothetical protein